MMTLDPILARLLVDRLTAAEHEIGQLKARLAAIEGKVLLDYRGVWQAGQKYQRGACCTDHGALWIAEQETQARPNGPDSGWKLAVKRGDAAPAEPRIPTDREAATDTVADPGHRV